MLTQTINKSQHISRSIYLIICCFGLLLFAAIDTRAQDSLKITLGKKTWYTATVIKGDEPATSSIPAATMRKAFSTVTVYFGLQQKNLAYKNTLQFVYTTADGTEKSIDRLLVSGKAIFPGATFKKLLTTFKSLKLRLIQNPANPRMSIASRIRDLLIINTH